MLFEVGAHIPEPVRLPRPRATESLAPFAAVLSAAEAVALCDLDQRSRDRQVRVGGERRPAEALLPGDALLDDGTAVVPLVIGSRPGRSALRSALTARFVLVTGIVRELDGRVAIEADEATDLRVLASAWAQRR